jgi:hypothetical protein
MRHVQNGTPVVLGGALVVPAGLIRQLRGEGPVHERRRCRRTPEDRATGDARRHGAERAKGHTVVDVSADKCGWDVSSYPPAAEGKQPEPIHIEVKGRVAGADTITVTRNEIIYAVNQSEKFRLAIVFVNDDDSVDGPHYIANPFQREPDWGAASVNYVISELLARGGLHA